MNQPFNEIIEQIKNGEIKFHTSDRVFKYVEPKNIDQLIYIVVENYAYDTIEGFGNYIDYLAYRTEGSDMLRNEIIEQNIKSTGFYFDIAGPEYSSLMVEVEFPEYDDETDFEEYINDLLDLIDGRIINRCYEFDADEEFDKLWSKSSQYSAREFLRMLDEDEEFFEKLSDKIKKYRIYGA